MALAIQPGAHGPAGQTGGSAEPTASIVADGAPIAVPDAALLFDADFVRSGDDLTLAGHDGQGLLIVDYFGAGAPDLIAPNQAMLDGQTVTLLAGPQFPGQYAQAGGAPQAAEPIGAVETLQGTVTAQRADGVTYELKAGDPVFESDVIATGPGSHIGMKLADGTLVTLQESGRLAINEFVYQADGADNSALLNVIEGTFSLFAGQVAPTGDMKIKTPIATMGIRGTSILGVDVDAILGRLALTQDPDGHVGFIEIFNNQNGNLFTVLRTVFEKITISETGLLSLTPKTPEELSIDQTLTDLLHNFHNQTPQQGPDETPRPQTGSPFFQTPNTQEINLDDTPPPQDAPELIIPSELLEQFIESLLQIQEIRDEIILALTPPAAGRVVLDDQLEGGIEGGHGGEGGGSIETTLPFQFGSSGPGSVGFAALDGKPVVGPGCEPVTNGDEPLVYSWDPATNTLTAVIEGEGGAPGETIFTIVVNPVTGEVSVTINGAVDHVIGDGNGELLSIDIPFTVQAANGQTVTGTLTVGITDDEPVAVGDVAAVSAAGPQVPGSNIVILMDRSGSMDGERLDLAKSAAMNLTMAAGIAQILVVDFANGVNDSNWQSPEDAQAYIAGLSAFGNGTDLDGALTRVVAEYGNAVPAENTYIYVVSDGGASTGFFGFGGDHVDIFEEVLWKTLLAAGQVDGVFGYSVGGNGESQLGPVGWDPAHPFDRPDVASLDDPGQLIQHFYEQIGYTPPEAEGNVLANDDLGADGLGGIQSIVIDGVTYQYDAESGAIITLPGGEQGDQPEFGDGWVKVFTAQGGQFTFHFADGGQGAHEVGDWSYTAPLYGNSLPYEHVRYTVMDGDGDPSTSDLIIEIDPQAVQNVAIGGEGDDTLASSQDPAHVDVLVGGLGADTFVLNSFEVSDFIADYDMGEVDVIDLSALLEGYNNANGTSLSGKDFLANNVSYDPESGQISVDSNGDSSFDSVVATLGNTPANVTIVVDDSGGTHTVNPVNV